MQMSNGRTTIKSQRQPHRGTMVSDNGNQMSPRRCQVQVLKGRPAMATRTKHDMGWGVAIWAAAKSGCRLPITNFIFTGLGGQQLYHGM